MLDRILHDFVINLMTVAIVIFFAVSCRNRSASEENRQGNDQRALETMEALQKRIMREPEIPEPNIPLFVVNRDQAIREYQFRYMSDHFFDHIDFSDPRLIQLPGYGDKLKIYFTQLVIPQPDSLIDRTSLILNKTKVNDSVYVWTARYLYNMFREAPIKGNTEIYNAIAENYIIRDSLIWQDREFVMKARERMEKSLLNAEGSVATDLHLVTPAGKTKSLHSVGAPLTVILFFDPGCDACHPVTAGLLELYKSHPGKFEVYAVYTGRVKEDWLEYIRGKSLKWINVWDPSGEQAVESKYDVHSMPLMYLLDKDKKVLSRDLTIEELNSILFAATI